MQAVKSPARLLDRLLLLWVMPPLGFVITVSQSPDLRYLTTNYVLGAVLLGAIFLRWRLRAPSRQLAIRLMLAALLLAALLGIEWIHFLSGRRTIDGLEDARMIIYSPLYGSIILFVLYAMYVAMLDSVQQQRHLEFFVKLMCGYHLLFLGYWVLLYLGWIPEIPRAELLRSNSTAYGALFALCIMILYRERIGLGWRGRLFFSLVNIFVIAVNQTRGAILALLAVLFYLLLKRVPRRSRLAIAVFLLGATIGIVEVATLAQGTPLTKVLGRDAEAIVAVLNVIGAAYEAGDARVDISHNLVLDESSLSAFSRIGSNYYSLLSFLDNPVLGLGQAEAYGIKVIGSSVHSLHFLIAHAAGFAGLALFAALLLSLATARGPATLSGRFAVMFLLCFGYMLIFVNAVPIYFVLVLMTLTENCSKSAVPAGR